MQYSMKIFIPLNTMHFAASDDFSGTAGMMLDFDQSTRNVLVNISISDDSLVEGTETFQVSLTAVDRILPYTVTPSLTTVYILDNDGMLSKRSL